MSRLTACPKCGSTQGICTNVWVQHQRHIYFDGTETSGEVANVREPLVYGNCMNCGRRIKIDSVRKP